MVLLTLLNSKQKKMNGEQIETLIELFCQEPCLWNSQDMEYINADSKAIALQKISAVLQLPIGELHRSTHMLYVLCCCMLVITVRN